MSAPLILAIESATSRVGCAVGTVDGVLAAAHAARGRHHAESLVPQIRFTLELAGLAIDDLDLIAVDVGPGLYTGLRVGLTTARAMAHSLGVPLIGVSSLEAVADRVRHGGGEVVAVLDARRGEVFHGCFDCSGSLPVATTEAAVGDPAILAASLAARAGRLRIVGDGARAHADVFAANGLRIGEVDDALPAPEAVLRLAAARADEAAAPALVAPLYLRRPDAVANWERAG
ncbi:MAG: tRNA (adenosine(37)-N6)-threonylcarbamoyltransferase complex dimerization subunit type 1 TsaB [Acidimicrobiales bacterium]